jgi:thiosulfate/3-mercaptopyruvate sulfurtransferase
MTPAPIPPLVSTEWLAAHLADPGLRVFDCTTFLHPEPSGRFRIENGRAPYEEGHIPGAGLLDLQGELSDRTSSLRFTMPPAHLLADTLGARGIGDDSTVVLYCLGLPMWATRVWWMLRAIGFDRAAILDGGISKWHDEGRPLSTEPCAYEPAMLTVRARPELFVDRHAMQAAIGRSGTVTVNALTEEQHRGTGGPGYGRPGRIAGSVCLPSVSLLTEDKTLRPLPELRAAFAAIGANTAERVLCYCGGGIAATLDAFVLTALLGHRDVAVYDASMQEWARDPSLPMETG